jgi:hypothetical protein
LNFCLYFRYAKTANTQLAWKMEAVEPSALFPLGVCTHYRAFANDSNYEIVRDRSAADEIGYKAVRTHCRWEPRARLENGNVSGMYILRSIPRGPLLPAEFIEGSRAAAEQTVRDFKSQYDYKTQAIQEWDEFLEMAPWNDDVWEYMRRPDGLAQFKVPLYESLFSGISLRTHPQTIAPPESDFRPDTNAYMPDTSHIENISATPSVQWSARGIRLPYIPPRVRSVDGTIIESLNEMEILTCEEYRQLVSAALQELCRQRGLSAVGRKEMLIKRYNLLYLSISKLLFICSHAA